MAKVELLYFPGCPHVSAAREQLRRAFEAIGASPSWNEVDLTADGVPEHARGYGSPTIIVDGKDVTGAPPGGGSACRVYAGSEVRGVPPLDAIVGALVGSTSSSAIGAVRPLTDGRRSVREDG